MSLLTSTDNKIYDVVVGLGVTALGSATQDPLSREDQILEVM